MLQLVSDLDFVLAGRIRECRKQLGMSQEDLASHLGVSFQQVQKYERGINRITAARLFEIARIFRIPVEALYPSSEDAARQSQLDQGEFREISEFTLSSEGWRLCRAFIGLPDPSVRRSVIQLVEQLKDSDPSSMNS